VRLLLEPPDEPLVVGHVADEAPLDRAVLVGEGPPLGVRVLAREFLEPGAHDVRDEPVEHVLDVELVAEVDKERAELRRHLRRDEVRVVLELFLPPQEALEHQLDVVGALSNELALVHVPHEVQLRPLCVEQVSVRRAVGPVHRDTKPRPDAKALLEVRRERAVLLRHQ
jgi:hypothetical protein